MRIHLLAFLILLCLSIHSQENDSTRKSNSLVPHITTSTVANPEFETKKGLHESRADEASLNIGGYVSAYYALYDDETDNGGYVQFPTMAARNHEFGINTALVSMKYSSNILRGNVGIHFGDIASTVWPSQYNMIQEANAGVKLVKKLWLDAGFFKSHIGVESTEPRENIASSIALVDNFEPYYFSGAKLTYEFSKKLVVQLNAFNSWGTFVDNNKDKLIGTSITFCPNESVSMTYNFLQGTDSPDSIPAGSKQVRSYNNFYLTYTKKKFLLALEGNYGWQTNSNKDDSRKNAILYSGLVVGRYMMHPKFGVYARYEFLSDYSQVTTGSIDFGKMVLGTTGGMEFKPYNNVGLSLEWRNLSCDKTIFRQGDVMTNHRNEYIFCLDVWF